MNALDISSDLFFNKTDLDQKRVENIVCNALHHADAGELYLEYSTAESLSLEDGQVKSANDTNHQGFGLRAVAGEAVSFAHTPELTESALKRCAKTAESILHGYQGSEAPAPIRAASNALYTYDNPLRAIDFKAKLDLLQKIDAYTRSLDPRIKHVYLTLNGSWKIVHLITKDGRNLADIRPLVQLNIQVIMEENGRQESGGHGCGARDLYEFLFVDEYWQAQVYEAIEKTKVNLTSIPAPAGEMTVVLGPGWPGVLLHEAIGHGLEGDFNRKKTSAFAELLGEKVASDEVTIIDSGIMEKRRGSLNMDDEGTATQATTLIEKGKLVGYMQDLQNSRLMGVAPTGNGRRQGYNHLPMPRMTNTYMLSGDKPQEELIRSVKKGIFASNFGGGQVDITSGKFVFECTQAYLIEDGKLGAAVKGATLIGNGPDVLTKVSMVGNDLEMDPGIGYCGKNG